MIKIGYDGGKWRKSRKRKDKFIGSKRNIALIDKPFQLLRICKDTLDYYKSVILLSE